MKNLQCFFRNIYSFSSSFVLRESSEKPKSQASSKEVAADPGKAVEGVKVEGGRLKNPFVSLEAQAGEALKMPKERAIGLFNNDELMLSAKLHTKPVPGDDKSFKIDINHDVKKGENCINLDELFKDDYLKITITPNLFRIGTGLVNEEGKEIFVKLENGKYSYFNNEGKKTEAVVYEGDVVTQINKSAYDANAKPIEKREEMASVEQKKAKAIDKLKKANATPDALFAFDQSYKKPGPMIAKIISEKNLVTLNKEAWATIHAELIDSKGNFYSEPYVDAYKKHLKTMPIKVEEDEGPSDLVAKKFPELKDLKDEDALVDFIVNTSDEGLVSEVNLDALKKELDFAHLELEDIQFQPYSPIEKELAIQEAKTKIASLEQQIAEEDGKFGRFKEMLALASERLGNLPGSTEEGHYRMALVDPLTGKGAPMQAGGEELPAAKQENTKMTSSDKGDKNKKA